MTRDTATLMVGQYFKRRRELVEIFLVSGSGLGVSVMSSILRWLVRDIGWRLGIQVELRGLCHNVIMYVICQCHI